jgi:threonine synthase
MSQGQISGMRCLACGRSVSARGEAPACPDCGDAGLLDLTYDLDDAARTLDRASLERREPWMWRYRELLPMDELAELPSLQVGMTPVYGAPRLAQRLGAAGLWLKDEGRSPTRSVWDRAALLTALMARERGQKVLAASGDSTALGAAACAAAALGLRAAAFGGTGAALARAFGAASFTGNSGAEDLALCREAAARLSWANATEGTSPYIVDGLKTVAHEIAEQLIERAPDWIAVPSAPASLVVAVAKGLREMAGLGLLRAPPRLLAVELAAEPDRAAEGPGGAASAARQAVSELSGAVVRVDAELAKAAMGWAAIEAGVEASAAGAAALAGLARALEQGRVERASTALVLLTGGSTAAGESEATSTSDLAAVERAARALGLA